MGIVVGSRRRPTALTTATRPPNQTAAAATWADVGEVGHRRRRHRARVAAEDEAERGDRGADERHLARSPLPREPGRDDDREQARAPMTSAARPMPSAMARRSTAASVMAPIPRPVASAPWSGTCEQDRDQRDGRRDGGAAADRGRVRRPAQRAADEHVARRRRGRRCTPGRAGRRRAARRRGRCRCRTPCRPRPSATAVSSPTENEKEPRIGWPSSDTTRQATT